ncbi:hypothetical protein NDU88_010605 [Pleurodeles waltl]|uniref:Secreted protein n=1 Tax=Pleurodeles waltl TaxID=8319 RepID=A0AAV7PYJ4_PLEWA|nr:hypothetical protein NDU88_010605 [Pleurodeles waltl]
MDRKKRTGLVSSPCAIPVAATSAWPGSLGEAGSPRGAPCTEGKEPVVTGGAPPEVEHPALHPLAAVPTSACYHRRRVTALISAPLYTPGRGAKKASALQDCRRRKLCVCVTAHYVP